MRKRTQIIRIIAELKLSHSFRARPIPRDPRLRPLPPSAPRAQTTRKSTERARFRPSLFLFDLGSLTRYGIAVLRQSANPSASTLKLAQIHEIHTSTMLANSRPGLPGGISAVGTGECPKTRGRKVTVVGHESDVLVAPLHTCCGSKLR